MKMLTDQELDSLTKDCIGESDDVIVANIGVYWDQIIAQAKLAYSIQQKAAECGKDAEIAAAARNLVAQKGRHNTEIAYARLSAAIAAAKEKKMTARELFESKFPVPYGAFWQDDRYMSDFKRDISIALHHNLLWIGFQAGAKRKQCVWTYCDDEMAWESECEGMLQMEDSPKESEFKYCCYCGGALVEAGDA